MEILATDTARAPGLIIPAHGGKLIDQIRGRRELVKDSRNYEVWGRMWRLIFDPYGMSRPDPLQLDHPVFHINELSWESNARNAAPVLALSRNDRELLILAPIPALPEVSAPDAANNLETWVPTSDPGWAAARGRNGEGGRKPRTYAQRYSDYTVQFIPDRMSEPDFREPDCFFVIHPVHQMYVQLAGRNYPCLIEPLAGGDGRQMSFLVNPRTGEAHFIGGMIQMSTRLHSLPEGAKP